MEQNCTHIEFLILVIEQNFISDKKMNLLPSFFSTLQIQKLRFLLTIK